jgi:hypothetical protein
VWCSAALAQEPGGKRIPLFDEREEEEELVPGMSRTSTASEEPAEELPEDKSVEDRLRDLEIKLEEYRARLESAEANTSLKDRISISGYGDVGFFVPSGNGSGIVQDFGNVRVPSLKQYGWVFLGDLLSTAVNSRGEVADLGNEPGVTRYDGIHSQGAAGFILNEVNLQVNTMLTPSTSFFASVDFVPRTGSDFSLGDFIDVDLAHLQWFPTDDQKLRIQVGKIDSVFGIEYRERKANRRFGITPSLIARYTTGTPLGISARGSFLGDHLILAAAVTNGSTTIEMFHFYNETDTNNGKTLTGRAALSFGGFDFLGEGLAGKLQIGLDGEWGPQDRARDDQGTMWFLGADLIYSSVDLMIKAQLIAGGSPGRASDNVYALDLHPSGYVEIDYMLVPMVGIIGRVERRDALITLGTERAYLSKVYRVTGGVRIVFSSNIVLKAEYLANGEYGELPSIKNDVFTSSLVLSY